jgi:hypothetical protein
MTALVRRLAADAAKAEDLLRAAGGDVGRLEWLLTATGDNVPRLEELLQAAGNDGAKLEEAIRAADGDLDRAEQALHGNEPPVDPNNPQQPPANPPLTPAQDALRQRLELSEDIARTFNDAQAQQLTQLSEGLSRDRLNAMRAFIENNAGKGRDPDAIVDSLLGVATNPEPDAPTLGEFLDQYARVRWEPFWRGRAVIEDGNANEGWQHIEARHITGADPGGDLFPDGTTRADLEEAAAELTQGGSRLSNPYRRMQTFTGRIKVHGVSMNVSVTIDAVDGRVITIFPMGG